MARKVLISFLGTGVYESKEKRTYRTTNYHLEDEELGEFPFMSAALKKHYGIDTTLLIGTTHSMWEEVYRWYTSKKSPSCTNEDVYLDIADACEKANHKSPLAIPHKESIEQVLGKDSKVVLIKYGINETEIKENVNIILSLQEHLQKNDELIVDVTHSFRSLPMYMMNLLIYLKNVSNKNISISHIYYGMFEARTELGFVPIIDLKTIMDVNDWMIGAYSFSQFGNAYTISRLMKDENRSVTTLLTEFSNLMNLNYLFAIQNIAQRLSALKNMEYNTMLPQLIINPIVCDFVEKFHVHDEQKHALFQLKVARWQLDHKKYASALISSIEAMVTHVCEENRKVGEVVFEKTEKVWEDYDFRELAKERMRKGHDGEIPLKCDKELCRIFKRLNPYRNSIAHHLEQTENAQSIINAISDNIIKLERIIK